MCASCALTLQGGARCSANNCDRWAVGVAKTKENGCVGKPLHCWNDHQAAREV